MNVIDLSKLENVKKQPDGSIIAGCPCCINDLSRDHTKDHLRVWPDYAFNCLAYPGEKDHNKRILQLVGTEIDINSPDYVAPQKEESRVVMPKSWNIEVLSGLLPSYKYWNDRGISSETCSYFKMGIAVKGQLAGRVVLPILDKNNPDKLIGFSGRALKKEMAPKWKHIGEKNKFLIPAIDKEIIESKSIILVESPGCFLTLFDHKIKNTLCLFGVNVTGSIMAYLIKMNPGKIIISTNNEPSNNFIGNIAAKKIEKQLLQFFNSDKIIIHLPNKKDFNEMNREEIENWYKNN
jgi:hypothetical protein